MTCVRLASGDVSVCAGRSSKWTLSDPARARAQVAGGDGGDVHSLSLVMCTECGGYRWQTMQTVRRRGAAVPPYGGVQSQ